MNEVLKVIKNRRSCRSYKPEAVEREKVEAILEAGTYAASGMGKQAPIIIDVTDKDLIAKLSKENAKIVDANMDPFYGAPEVIIVLAKKSIPTFVYDGSLVIGNMMLAAESLGVSSCWIHRAKEEFEVEVGKEILDKLGITDEYEGIGHLIIGYSASGVAAAAPRKEDYVYTI